MSQRLKRVSYKRNCRLYCAFSLSRTPPHDSCPGYDAASPRSHQADLTKLQRLHWLPVRQRLLLKIAVLVYQCLNGQAPSYLADDCQLVFDIRPRRLRSSDSGFCAIRRSRTIRRPVFCCRRPTSVELLANRTKTLTVLPSSNGDSFVWVIWDHSAL